MRTLTPFGRALALRQYVDRRAYGRKISNGHGLWTGARVRDERPHFSAARLSPALVAAADAPEDEASLVLSMSPYLIAGMLDKLEERGRQRLALDPQAGEPTGRPLRPASKPGEAEPEPKDGPTPEPSPEFGR